MYLPTEMVGCFNPHAVVVPYLLFDQKLSYVAPGLYSYHVDVDCLGVHRKTNGISLPAYDSRNILHSADPHGGDIVGDEMWMIDQSPTGITIDCEDDESGKTMSYLKYGRLRDPIECPQETQYTPVSPLLPPFIVDICNTSLVDHNFLS